jgi:hypothetical protein
VEIGTEVKLERIAGSLTIYGAARICGEKTLIAEDVRLGYEAPVTLIDCQVGPAVELKGGYFADSVFLEKAVMGSNAQVRGGCLLEEESGGNHTVGLKQTILFPFVTLGSLINFCDCLMAGGTSRKNHSEVGSSYIHFNFTPRQDKATASLLGEVPRGVMLKEKPIFLGGQGGMVGPLQLDYGTVVPAGLICRRVVSAAGRKNLAGTAEVLQGKIFLNVLYISNLLALKQWYLHVRRDFFLKQKFGAGLYEGAFKVLEEAVTERREQLKKFAEKMETSLSGPLRQKKNAPSADFIRAPKEFFLLQWPQIEAYLATADVENMGQKQKQDFLKIIRKSLKRNKSYLETIKFLTPAEAKAGTDWLQQIVDGITRHCFFPPKKKR